MLHPFRADLHIHTCLSPCADLWMSPRAIVERALSSRIDIVAVTDHNSAENVTAVVTAARGTPLKVLPGMEATSAEEVHILALFDSPDGALQLQRVVYEHLPGENDEEAFGLQVVVNEENDVLGFNPRLLLGATELTVDQVVEAIHELGGLAVAAHIDREAFGIMGQLGFIPEDLALDALELSSRTTVAEARRRYPECAHFPFIRSSDAHELQGIGRATTSLLISEVSTAEIRRALAGEDGRQVLESAPAKPARRG